jgi:D-sedoheptulose 7-phosphate isomerase
MQYVNIIKGRINESIEIKRSLLENENLISTLSELASVIITTIKNGNKLIICGNGGSASDALHFAGEIVGRFQKERDAWSAIVLNSDVATMTAIANDYGYNDIFARQAQGHVKQGDVFIGISTSGNSENVYRAAIVSKEKGAVTAALLGCDGGRIGRQVDYPIIVPSETAARVQECHILLIHILCELVEREIT